MSDALNAEPRDRRDVALMIAKAALHEAAMEILYLRDFQRTGSGTAAIARIERALADIERILR